MTYFPAATVQAVQAVVPSSTITKEAAPKASNTPTTATTTADEQSGLSSTSALISQALATSDVRLDKVASLQQSIADGTYSVSASDVAGKLLDSLIPTA